MLRTNSPAPITSSSETATCATTSAFRSPKRDDPAPGVPSFSANVSDGRVLCSAGASPNRIPVNSETAAVNPISRRSGVTTSVAFENPVCGKNASSACTPR